MSDINFEEGNGNQEKGELAEITDSSLPLNKGEYPLFGPPVSEEEKAKENNPPPNVCA